jgi:hypothetical protein
MFKVLLIVALILLLVALVFYENNDANTHSVPVKLLPLPTAVRNPYNNTLPYDTDVNYQKPKIDFFADDSLERIYKGTDENSQGWFFNTVPDPTLMARPVHWTQDSRPDIVSKEADCSYRFCR